MKKELLNTFINALKQRKLLLCRSKEELNLIHTWIAQPLVKPEIIVEAPKIGSLDEEIQQCIECGTVSEKKQPFGSGVNGVMIILYAPRMLSRIEKAQYKDESIDLLKKMVSAVGLSLKECYVTNLIKCEVEDVHKEPSDMLHSCEKLLQKEMSGVNPRYALVLGDILPLQDTVHSSTSITWFQVDHPITLLKNPSLKRRAWETLKALHQELTS